MLWTGLVFFWLKKLSGPHIASRQARLYGRLTFDGHGSHVIAEFDQYCSESNTIVLCMPPYPSHLLQPLDVSLFKNLKLVYLLRAKPDIT